MSDESKPAVEKWEALLAKQDPSEYSLPACPDQVFGNDPGEITVRSYLHDPYQAGLIQAGWLVRLVDVLRSYPELVSKSLTVQLRPTFNKAQLDSGKGYPIGSDDDEENNHKNRFLLEIAWLLPSSSPLEVRYAYEILYNPRSREHAFQMLSCESEYFWRPGSDEADLEQRLLHTGILREVAVAEPDPGLATLSMRGTLDRPESVPVEKRKHVLSIAIDDPRNFPVQLAAWQMPHRIAEPVLVRNRKRLQEYRDELYRGREIRKVAMFRGYKPAAESSLKQVDREELATALASIRGEEHFHVNYFNAWTGSLDVRLSRSKAVVSGLREEARLLGLTPSGVWDKLIELSQDLQIWQPPPYRRGMDGWTWTLMGPDLREVSLWCPDTCPMVEFCFQVMTLAGLELDIERYVQWHIPAQKDLDSPG